MDRSSINEFIVGNIDYLLIGLVLFGIIATVIIVNRLNESIRIQKLIKKRSDSQIKILQQIYLQLGGTEPVEVVSEDITINGLTQLEVSWVEELKNDLGSDEIIVKVKQSDKIEVMTIADWNDIKKLGNEHKFQVLFHQGNLK